MAMRDEIDTPGLAVIAFVGAIVVLLVVLLVQVFYFEVSQRLERQRYVDRPDRALAEYYASQREALHRWAWVDAKAGAVTIPIERAMELTVCDLAAGGSAKPHRLP